MGNNGIKLFILNSRKDILET